jgi:hypothetical protein
MARAAPKAQQCYSKSVLPGLETFSLTAAIPAPMLRATFITLPVLAVR